MSEFIPGYLLQSALLMAVLYLPYHLLFRTSTYFRYNRLYLLASLAIALIAPLFSIPISAGTPEIISVMLEPVQVARDMSNSNMISASGTKSLPWLSIGYTLVTLVLFMRIVRQLYRIAAFYRTGAIVQAGDVLIIRHNGIDSPFSFFNLVFLPGTDGNDLLSDQMVIEHERTHATRLHSIDICILEVMSAILWVNPFIYLYRKAIADVHEYEADEAAGTNNKAKYARILISAAQPEFSLAFAHTFITSPLQNRIKMMMKERSPRRSIYTYAMAIPVLLLAFALAAFQLPQQPPTASQADQEVFKIVEEMPRFPGCEDQPKDNRNNCSLQKLMTYMAENIEYPKSAKKDSVEGKVVVKFNVEANGLVSKIQVVRGLTSDCDAEVIRVMETMNSMPKRWVPGKQRGKNVTVEMTLPVLFALQ